MSNKAARIGLVFLSVLTSVLFYAKIEWIHRGGPLMVPLILLSIASSAIIAAKMARLREDQAPVSSFLNDIFELIEKQRLKEAIDLCERAQTSFARILKEGIVKYDRPKDEIREAMDHAFLYEVPSYEENISVLAAVIQIAPLLGFLGTLVGMAKVFFVVQAKGISFAPVVSADLAAGVWGALISACAGFLIAISTLIAYYYLTARIRSYVEEMERGASELLNFLMERRMPA